MHCHPCRKCQMLDQVKNNEICRHCNKRLQYIDKLERPLNFPRSSDKQPFALSGRISLSGSSRGVSGNRIFVN